MQCSTGPRILSRRVRRFAGQFGQNSLAWRVNTELVVFKRHSEKHLDVDFALVADDGLLAGFSFALALESGKVRFSSCLAVASAVGFSPGLAFTAGRYWAGVAGASHGARV